MFAQYFEYYAITLRGAFFADMLYKGKKMLPWQRPFSAGYQQYLHSVG